MAPYSLRNVQKAGSSTTRKKLPFRGLEKLERAHDPKESRGSSSTTTNAQPLLHNSKAIGDVHYEGSRTQVLAGDGLALAHRPRDSVASLENRSSLGSATTEDSTQGSTSIPQSPASTIDISDVVSSSSLSSSSDVVKLASTTSESSLPISRFSSPDRKYASSTETDEESVDAYFASTDQVSQGSVAADSTDDEMLSSDEETIPPEHARIWAEKLAQRTSSFIHIFWPGQDVRFTFDYRPKASLKRPSEEHSQLYEDAMCLAQKTGARVKLGLVGSAESIASINSTRFARRRSSPQPNFSMMGRPVPVLMDTDADGESTEDDEDW
ncbi:hypothetical protein LTR70_002336 [Exophiala xenobiotica]|uniref:Uncharacterized protein n=1 Tax=Lithohypha guttulata TaxID=1690604 RepID=A0ABR0KL26_9EURO|nr:hypothetical protein LTR24_001242 [Lithohypha guttulata]KAK5326071.1 hypothetical protein LTR70_002336 [Exophiala xenobiotica]